MKSCCCCCCCCHILLPIVRHQGVDVMKKLSILPISGWHKIITACNMRFAIWIFTATTGSVCLIPQNVPSQCHFRIFWNTRLFDVILVKVVLTIKLFYYICTYTIHIYVYIYIYVYYIMYISYSLIVYISISISISIYLSIYLNIYIIYMLLNLL